MAKRSEPLRRAQEAYEAKTVKLNLRLSQKEKDRLDELAVLAGMKPTTLIKQWIAEAS
jgi:predicted DNA binding CopG/RHH family protein